jgi:iron complex outermembrane receptor protein
MGGTIMGSRLKFNLVATCSAAALAMGIVPTAVSAQAATNPERDDRSSETTVVSDIVVTGSRIARGGTFTAPTPVTSQTVTELTAAEPSTLAASLKTLPAVDVGGGPTAGGGTGNGGQNYLSLRGLGAGRTLTLVDGRRFTPSNPNGGVDANLIPGGVVQRVDIVTGGASAAYGSDAVSGVINFVLRKNFEGLELEAHHGRSEHDDNIEYKATGTWGKNSADGRSNIIVGYEYFENQGVDGSARDFRRSARNIIPNPSGAPAKVIAEDVRTPYTEGGLLVRGVLADRSSYLGLAGVNFLGNGAWSNYDYGTVSNTYGRTSGFQSGGDGFRVSTGQEIVRPLSRNIFYTRAQHQIDDRTKVFVEGSFGRTESLLKNSPTTQTLQIRPDNAFLLRDYGGIAAEMLSANVSYLELNRLTLEDGRHTATDNQNETIRVLGGLQGDFGGWQWSASAQLGRNTNDSQVLNNIITGNMTSAVDAIFDPMSGNIVCRSAAARAAGCVPFNPLGAGSPSDEALDFVFGTLTSTSITEMRGFEFGMSGTVLELPAGALGVAFGAEYREDEASTVADPLSQAGGYRLVNIQNFGGSSSTKEAYVELDAPILANMPFIAEFSVNGAYRYADYSFSGGASSWKLGANWSVTDELRLRTTQSRDIRAPNLTELYATGRQNNITIDDTLFTGRTYLSVPNKTFGNINLTPEEADTFVVGAIYSPKWAVSLNFALDYYSIRINDAIGNMGGNNAVRQCNLSNQTGAACSLVTRDPATLAVIATRQSPINMSVEKASGIDFEGRYSFDISDTFGLDGDFGSLSVRAVVGYLRTLVTISPLSAEIINEAGEGGRPNWRGNASVTYDRGPFQARLQGRYVGDWLLDRTEVIGTTVDFNRVASRGYLDANFKYEISDQLEMFVNVQNVLDRAPALAPSPSGATPLPTNSGLYDQVGRNWRVGVRFSF